MNSFRGNATHGRDPDNCRFTVEGCPSGESPFPLDLNTRKILHSSEYARCNSRPPPEGAGSVTVSESERRDGKGSFCQQCEMNVTELKRQALALADPSSLKDPGYAAFLFDQLQVPGSHEGCCQVCSTPLHQLRQEALQTVGASHAALTLSHDMPALPSTTLSGQPHKLTLSSSNAQVRQPSKAHAQAHTILPLRESWHRGQDCPQGSSVSAGPKTSVQVTVGGGQLTGTLGSVTIQAQQYLEGMWSISRVNNFLPQPSPAQGLMGDVERDVPVPASEAPVHSSNCSLTPSRQRSSVQLGQCDVTPPAPGHTSTTTSTQSASAAASFFIRYKYRYRRGRWTARW